MSNLFTCLNNKAKLDGSGESALVDAVKHLVSFGHWLMELFNPPLRDSLSLRQKMGRVALITVTLVTLSIIVALGISLALFSYESGNNILVNIPHLANALEILTFSIAVNVVSVLLLFQVKRFDQRLMRRPVGPLSMIVPPSSLKE